jgi:hypothetical protein
MAQESRQKEEDMIEDITVEFDTAIELLERIAQRIDADDGDGTCRALEDVVEWYALRLRAARDDA